jgi:hypothetical protein
VKRWEDWAVGILAALVVILGGALWWFVSELNKALDE